MATPWPGSLARADLAADKPAAQQRIEDLLAQQEVMREWPVTLEFAEASGALPTVTRSVVRHSLIAGKTLHLVFEARVSGGSGQVRASCDGAVSDWLPVTNTSYQEKAIDLPVSASNPNAPVVVNVVIEAQQFDPDPDAISIRGLSAAVSYWSD